MHEGIMLHLGDGDVRVRVRADAEPARDVVISRQANGLYKATAQEVHESIRQDSRPTPVSGASAATGVPIRSQCAVRAVVVISRSDAPEHVQLLTSCSLCASIVVVASLDWLFHCFVASTLRSPFLYAASPSPLPLSTVHTTSSGIDTLILA